MIRLILLQILLVSTTMVFSQNQRGRVGMQGGTLVTDRGTLLRGAFFSTDYTPVLPLKSQLSTLKDLGMNCIHLYAECPEFQKPGDRAALVDSMVKWTGQDSLYLILTIGGCNQNGRFDLDFVKGFWNFYASRYKDETHVIFEIVNEPFSWSAPYDAATLEMEKIAYDIIRAKAPDTHVLFMSFAQPINIIEAVSDIKKLGTGIDWKNASVAAHGYNVSPDDFTSFIHAVKDAGYAITITEPASIENKYLNMATTRIFETEFVSYTHFITLQSLTEDATVYKTLIEKSNLRWFPDFGLWPFNVSRNIFLNPYQPVKPAFFDEGRGIKVPVDNATIGYISNNDYVAFYTVDFQEGPDTFMAECSSDGLGGTIELHLDSIDGPHLGSCLVTTTGGWGISKPFSCSTGHFNGIHHLFLLFKGGIYDLFNLNSFVFVKTGAGFEEFPVSEDSGGVHFYPNPAHDLVRFNIDDPSTVEIYDTRGRLLIRRWLTPNDKVLSLHGWPPGSYLVKIITKSRVIRDILILKQG